MNCHGRGCVDQQLQINGLCGLPAVGPGKEPNPGGSELDEGASGSVVGLMVIYHRFKKPYDTVRFDKRKRNHILELWALKYMFSPVLAFCTKRSNAPHPRKAFLVALGLLRYLLIVLTYRTWKFMVRRYRSVAGVLKSE